MIILWNFYCKEPFASRRLVRCPSLWRTCSVGVLWGALPVADGCSAPSAVQPGLSSGSSGASRRRRINPTVSCCHRQVVLPSLSPPLPGVGRCHRPSCWDHRVQRRPVCLRLTRALPEMLAPEAVRRGGRIWCSSWIRLGPLILLWPMRVEVLGLRWKWRWGVSLLCRWCRTRPHSAGSLEVRTLGWSCR